MSLCLIILITHVFTDEMDIEIRHVRSSAYGEGFKQKSIIFAATRHTAIGTNVIALARQGATTISGWQILATWSVASGAVLWIARREPWLSRGPSRYENKTQDKI